VSFGTYILSSSLRKPVLSFDQCPSGQSKCSEMKELERSTARILE